MGVVEAPGLIPDICMGPELAGSRQVVSAIKGAERP
jgi:hypothetical protein